MTDGAKLFRSFRGIYAAHLFGAIAQLIYAAASSRLVSDEAFGAYSIAVLITGLVNLVFGSGIAIAVARPTFLPEAMCRGLYTYASIMGAISTLIVLATGLIGWLLNLEELLFQFLIAMAVNSLLVSLSAFLTGLLQRRGAFSKLSKSYLGSTLVATVAATPLVILNPTSIMLATFPIILQLCTTTFLFVSARFGPLNFGAMSQARRQVRYAGEVTFANIVAFGVLNFPKVVGYSLVGAPAMGQLNRAEVLGQVPFMQIYGAVSTVALPEYRKARDRGGDSREVFGDLIELVTYLFLGLSVLAATLTPLAIPFLLGPNWNLASTLVGLVVLSSAFQVIGSLLGGLLEIAGLARKTLLVNCWLFFLQIFGLIYVWTQNSIFTLVALTVGIGLLRIVFFTVVASKSSLVNGSALLRRLTLAILPGMLVIPFLGWRYAQEVWSFIPLPGQAVILLGLCLLLLLLARRVLAILKKYIGVSR